MNTSADPTNSVSPKTLIPWIYEFFMEDVSLYTQSLLDNSNPAKFHLLKKLNLLDLLEEKYLDEPDDIWYPVWSPSDRFQGDLDRMKKHFFNANWYRLYEYPSAVPLIEIRLKLLQEFNIKDDTNWTLMSLNPEAIHILEKHPDKIDINMLSGNPAGVHLLEKYPDKINWSKICSNSDPRFVSLVHKNKDKIVWEYLCRNTHPEAIQIIEQNLDKLNTRDWGTLSGNPAAIHLLERNPDKIEWLNLSENPAAIHLLEKNQDKICWTYLSKNPAAISILENNLDACVCDEGTTDEVCWYNLSENPEAIEILENNKEKIELDSLFRNPAIFEWIKIKYLHKGKILYNVLYQDLYNFIKDF